MRFTNTEESKDNGMNFFSMKYHRVMLSEINEKTKSNRSVIKLSNMNIN